MRFFKKNKIFIRKIDAVEKRSPGSKRWLSGYSQDPGATREEVEN
jgi:hypothetical protein